jgi:hypothetical protein
MTNDNNPRGPRRVYRVPVALTVLSDVFVLADSIEEARRQARIVDINAMFGFTPLTVHANRDDEAELRFNDVVVSVIDISGITLTTRPPNEHPDFINVGES